MKKIIITIAIAVFCAINVNAQLNITKNTPERKVVATISAYWIWIYQDTDGYYLAMKSSNRYDERFYWLSIGKDRKECLASIDGLLSIANGDYDSIYTIDDAIGGKVSAFRMKSLGEKMICITDTAHRYAGDAQLSSIYLNKAKKWINENVRGAADSNTTQSRG